MLSAYLLPLSIALAGGSLSTDSLPARAPKRTASPMHSNVRPAFPPYNSHDGSMWGPLEWPGSNPNSWPSSWRTTGHPFITAKAIQRLLSDTRLSPREKDFLRNNGGAIIAGAQWADEVRVGAQGLGDGVNHYYTTEPNHQYGCPSNAFVRAFLSNQIGYGCSYANAVEYADYVYAEALKHWAGTGLDTPLPMKFRKDGDLHELQMEGIVPRNSHRMAALYLGWTVHFLQDGTQPYHGTGDDHITSNYHGPFEGAVDKVITRGYATFPLSGASVPGGVNQGEFSRLAVPAVNSIYLRNWTPSVDAKSAGEAVRANIAASRPYIVYLNATVCGLKDPAELYNRAIPCDSEDALCSEALASALHAGCKTPLWTGPWGQAIAVSVDRAIKTSADRIFTFLHATRPPTIAPITEDGVTRVIGGPLFPRLALQIDHNELPGGIVVELRERRSVSSTAPNGRWIAAYRGTSHSVTLDPRLLPVQDGIVDVRVLGCYRPFAAAVCRDTSAIQSVRVDRSAPTAHVEMAAGQTSVSGSVRLIASGYDASDIARITLQAATVGLWRDLADDRNHANFEASLDLSQWAEGRHRIRARVCDRAGFCTNSSTLVLRVEHDVVDLMFERVTAGVRRRASGPDVWPLSIRVQNVGRSTLPGDAAELVVDFGPLHKSSVKLQSIEGGGVATLTVDLPFDITACNKIGNLVLRPRLGAVTRFNETNIVNNRTAVGRVR